MKRLKIALLGIISIFILFFVFAPIKAEAATIIKSGKTIALKSNGSAPLYKFTVEEDSLVKVTWSNNLYENASLDLYADSKKQKFVTYANINDGKSGKCFFALKKGVYYVVMDDGYASVNPATTKVNFSWTPASDYNKGNFTASKAPILKANTMAHVVQTPGSNYLRYYKIKLTKDQKIQVTTPYGNNSLIELYSADWNTRYYLSSADSTIAVTYNKLKAGTYFVVVADCPRPYSAGVLGKYVAFKWK